METNLRVCTRHTEQGQTVIPFAELRKGDRFSLSGDELCPEGILVAASDADLEGDVWGVQIEFDANPQ